MEPILRAAIGQRRRKSWLRVRPGGVQTLPGRRAHQGAWGRPQGPGHGTSRLPPRARGTRRLPLLAPARRERGLLARSRHRLRRSPTPLETVRIVLQRVKEASVTVEGETISAIGPGLLLLVGVANNDSESEAGWLAEKISGLRIMGDEDGKMNRSVKDTGGAVLAVSQFTLLADTRKGRRPSFIRGGPAGRGRAPLRLLLRTAPSGGRRTGRERPLRGHDGRGARKRRPRHDCYGEIAIAISLACRLPMVGGFSISAGQHFSLRGSELFCTAGAAARMAKPGSGFRALAQAADMLTEAEMLTS